MNDVNVERRQIHRGRAHVVERATLPDGRVVAIKRLSRELPHPADVASLLHEHELLLQLSNIPGVVRVAALRRKEGLPELVLHFAGDRDLSTELVTGALPLHRFLPLAARVAHTLAQVHAAGIVHRDINPHNIVVDENDQPTLIDFGLATDQAGMRARPGGDGRVLGTPSWVPPEQTGLTGMLVDFRSDIYGLGATFYTMLAGRPPFDGLTPGALLHAHLARRPARLLGLPDSLADLVEQMLEKDPALRPLDVWEVLERLNEAAAELSPPAEMPPLPVLPPVARQVLPQGVHGREALIERIQIRVGDAARGRGGLILLEGIAGIGKSTLLEQLRGPVHRSGGELGIGRARRLDRSQPHGPIVEALSEVVGDLLRKELGSTQRLVPRLQRTLGNLAAPACALVPALDGLVRGSGAVPDLGPVEARQRTLTTLIRIITALGSPGRPLVLVLDDAQWMDPGDVDLITELAGILSSRSVLLLVAFRSEEVEPEGPLARLARNDGPADGPTAPIEHLRISPLDRDGMRALCQDVLAAPAADLEAIVDAVAARAGGNPMLAQQVLSLLEEEGVLQAAPRAWHWHPERLVGSAVPDEAEALLQHALAKLPPDAREVLSTAAVLGSIVRLKVLAELLGCSLAETFERLQPVLHRGLLRPEGDAWRTPRGEGVSEPVLAALDPSWRFPHARLRATAGALLSQQDRQALHLRTADLLGHFVSGEAHLNRFEHYLAAGPALQAADARLAAARVALETAAEALSSGASGETWLAASSGLEWLEGLPDDKPVEMLRLRLLRVGARAAWVVGKRDSAMGLLDRAEARAQDPTLALTLAADRLWMYTLSGDLAQVIATGRAALAAHDIQVPDDPSDAGAARLARQVRADLADIDLDRLAHAHPISDPRLLAQADVLQAMIPAAYFTNQPAFMVLVDHLVRITLDHGLGPGSGYALCFFGFNLLAEGDADRARETAETGLAIARRSGMPGLAARTLFTFAHHVNHWGAPLSSDAPYFDEALQHAHEAGDLQWAGYALAGRLVNRAPCCEDLATLLAEADETLAFLQRTGNQPMADMVLPFRQVARWLAGHTTRDLDEDGFDEAAYRASIEGNGTVEALYHSARLFGSIATGQVEPSIEHAAALRARLPYVRGCFAEGEHCFLEGLVHARLEAVEKVEAAAARLAVLAARAPENFAHKRRLLEGEAARSRGDRTAALDAFDEAGRMARRHGFIQDAALAYERAGSLLYDDGKRLPALAYLRAARDAWQLWQAPVVAARLERSWPELTGQGIDSGSGSRSSHDDRSSDEREESSGSQSLTTARIELAGVIQASEALTAELDLNQLVAQMLGLVLELSGARRAVLLVDSKDGLVALAMRDPDGLKRIGLPYDQAPIVCRPLVEELIANEGAVVINDARVDSRTAQDPWVEQFGGRSLLGVPATHQKRLVAVLQLDNDLAPRAFTSRRVSLLGLVATQIAISLENARLFDQVHRETEERLEAERQLQRAQKLESIGRLASGVAHDFNNLLAVIIGWGEVGRDFEGDDPTVSEAFQQILRSAERGAELTRRLLAVSRNVVSNPVPTDLYTSVTGLGRMVQHLLGDSISLVLEPPQAPLPTAMVDPALFEQVVLNLLVNARDAMPRGGQILVDFGTRRDPGDLPPGAYVMIRVHDQGAGIPEHLLDRVFEPFFTTKGTGGTGLGLSTCLSIAQTSGGTIQAGPHPDGGTTFTLLLPAAGEAVPDEPAAPEDPDLAVTGRLLIAEDDDELRTVLRQTLTNHGFEVHVAESGEAALALVSAGLRPDVLLTDLTMPGMTGIELIHAMRERLPDLPSALMSGVHQADDSSTLPDGVPFIQKPARPSALARMLTDLLLAAPPAAGEAAPTAGAPRSR